MVKKEINEIRSPTFTAVLSLHPNKHHYIEKAIVSQYGDAIHPAQDCYTDCLCSCSYCFHDENGCIPETCVRRPHYETCMKRCEQACDQQIG
jgi:hypothetical protein